MNFQEWYSKEVANHYNNVIPNKIVWGACKKEVLKIINETPLGYRTSGEHEKLEQFADLIEKKVKNL